MNIILSNSVAVLIAGSVLFSCNIPSGEKVKSNVQRPNIVLIVTDDLGWKDLACYGNPLHETPHIDRLAAASILFTDAYAAAPVCTPTRAAIMTGKWPARLHMTVWSENARGIHGTIKGQKLIPAPSIPDLPLQEYTIAEALSARGYHTIHIGKWHLGESGYYPENQGYEINIAGGSWGCPANFFFPYTGLLGSEPRYIPGLERSGTGGHNYFVNRKGEYLPDRLTDEAIQIIHDASLTNAPFFLSLNYYAVHTPIEAPDDLVKYYKAKNTKTGHESNPVYAAMVHKVDQNVGRILKEIRDLGIEDNTVVIFTSDNGGFINEWHGAQVADNSPLRSGKGSLYEGGIRIPLIIRYPGMRQVSCKTPVISNDLYPTLCELAGIKTDTLQSDGFSLLPVIQNPEAALSREYLFWHYPHYYLTTTPVTAVRYREWKLLKYYEDNRVELYNLENDIGEKHDLAKVNTEITDKILARLGDWLNETGAAFPSVNPDFKR